MKRQAIDPWGWQDGMGFVQANLVEGAQRIVLCSGQTSMHRDGHPLHSGDMRAQIAQALDNLETVLRAADMALANVVRLNWYVTDVDAYRRVASHHVRRLADAGCRPCSTLLGVRSLAYPELLVEVEATAVD
jgi:enamine deaminase RidA (YjgF/YER057c/UK114 family)